MRSANEREKRVYITSGLVIRKERELVIKALEAGIPPLTKRRIVLK